MKVVVVPLAVLLVLASATACGEDEAGSRPRVAPGRALGAGIWPGRRGVGGGGAQRDLHERERHRVNGVQPISRPPTRWTAPRSRSVRSHRRGWRVHPPADTVERQYVAALGQVKAWRSENDELTPPRHRRERRARLPRRNAGRLVAGDRDPAGRRNRGVRSPRPRSPPRSPRTARSPARPAATPTPRRTRRTRVKSRSPIPPRRRRHARSLRGIMQQEAAYLAALPTAVSFRVSAGSPSC